MHRPVLARSLHSRGHPELRGPAAAQVWRQLLGTHTLSRSAFSLRGRGLLTMVMARHPAPPVFKCMPVAVLALLLGCPHPFG